MGPLFPTLVYSLCFATSALCAFLLGRSYGRTRMRLLFWSAACFTLLSLVHFVVIIDLLVYPEIELRPVRLWLTWLGVAVLLFGFIWDEDT